MVTFKVAAIGITATVLALGAASPVFAKAHNNGVSMNERDIGHISGRDGSANTYLLSENPTAKNSGSLVSGEVSKGQQGAAQSGN